MVQEAEITDGGVGDRTVTDVDDLVRAVRAQPGDAVRADRELDPSAPAKPRLGGLVARQWLDRDLAVKVKAGHPAQLLGDDSALERALSGQ